MELNAPAGKINIFHYLGNSFPYRIGDTAVALKDNRLVMPDPVFLPGEAA